MKYIKSYQFAIIDFTHKEAVEIIGSLNECCDFYGAISLADFLHVIDSYYLSKDVTIIYTDIDHKVGWDSLVMPNERIYPSETPGMWHIHLPDLKPMKRILR